MRKERLNQNDFYTHLKTFPEETSTNNSHDAFMDTSTATDT